MRFGSLTPKSRFDMLSGYVLCLGADMLACGSSLLICSDFSPQRPLGGSDRALGTVFKAHENYHFVFFLIADFFYFDVFSSSLFTLRFRH